MNLGQGNSRCSSSSEEETCPPRPSGGGGSGSIYRDPNAAIECRVKDLISRMTLKEKVAQMTQIEKSVADLTAITQLSIGSVLSGGGSGPFKQASAANWADMVDAFQRASLKSRLGIPILYATDAVHGHNNVFGATIFPHNIGLGATRDRDLIQRIGVATAMEVRATGIHCTFAPCVAVCRDPRWGRCYECYSEDTEIVRTMTSIVKGLQGMPPVGHPNGYPFVAGSLDAIREARWRAVLEKDQLNLEKSNGNLKLWLKLQTKNLKLSLNEPVGATPAESFLDISDHKASSYAYTDEHICIRNVVACAKHFVGDGGTDRGINEGNMISSFDDLERIHMRPYLDCLAQGVSTVMASYSSWNGSKLHSNQFLLTHILKEKLNFKGFVISDWEGIDRLCHPHGSDYRYCISASINAGIDMVMVPFRYEKFLEDLVHLVESGEIQMARINDAVERILRVKFIAGLFEYPLSDRSLLDFVGCKIHRKLAREAVRKSLVLLKNGRDPKNPFLPLDKNARRILVAGIHADDIGYQCGGWTITWHGTGGRITIGTTILQAIKATVGEETEVVYEQYLLPDTLTGKNFSYAVVVVGEPAYAESLGDNYELEIPFNGVHMIDMITSIVPTLVILISGRPLVLEQKLLEKMDALVAAWLPGTEGGGITDVLFGDYEFEGKLPRTWFRSVDQLPMNAGDQSYDPLFPLGYGLKMNISNSSVDSQNL